MMKNIVLALIGGGLLIACSDAKKDESQHEVAPITSQQKHIEPEPALANTNENLAADAPSRLSKNLLAELPKPQRELRTNSAFSVNGEKFTLLSSTFTKGAKVYNRQMGEKGTVKGSIVVVSQGNSSFDEALYVHCDVAEIAQDTFRLVPPSTTDLMGFYKQLNTLPRFSVVEMEIDYSPIKERLAY